MFGWLSECTAALAEGPVQQLQVHWHPSSFHSRDYCAAADKFCWRHVLLSPHTNTADLMLWGNFRGCTFIEKTQKAQCFWTLSTPLPACCSAALLQLSKCGVSQKHRCPHQRHVYADGLCSKLTARVHAVTHWNLCNPRAKIHQCFQFHPWHELDLPEDGPAWVNWVSKEGHVLPLSYVSGQPSSKGREWVVKRLPEECPSACLTWLSLWFRKSPLFGGNKAGTLFQISGISLNRIWVPTCLWRADLCLRNLIPLNSPLTSEEGNCIL